MRSALVFGAVTALMLMAAVVDAIAPVADAPVTMDTTRVSTTLSIAFVSSPSSNAADVAALWLARSASSAAESAAVSATFDGGLATVDSFAPNSTSAANMSTTMLSQAAAAAFVADDAERTARLDAAERAVARDVVEMLLGTDATRGLAAAANASLGASIKAHARFESIIQLSATNVSDMSVATFTVLIDLSALDQATVERGNLGQTCVDALGNVSSLAVTATSNATVVMQTLGQYNATSDTVGTTGAPLAHTAGWLSSVARTTAVTLDRLGVGAVDMRQQLDNLVAELAVVTGDSMGTATASASNATSTAMTAQPVGLVGVSATGFAARLMRQAFFLDRRGGVAPAWKNTDITAVQGAVLRDMAAVLGFTPLAGGIPTATEELSFLAKRDTGASPATRVLATIELIAPTAAQLNNVATTLSGRRIRLPSASQALAAQLSTTRETPLDLLVLRTTSEQQLLDAGAAPGRRGCAHLGCWVPLVLWCLFLGLVGFVLAIATTGRAVTVDDDVFAGAPRRQSAAASGVLSPKPDRQPAVTEPYGEPQHVAVQPTPMPAASPIVVHQPASAPFGASPARGHTMRHEPRPAGDMPRGQPVAARSHTVVLTPMRDPRRNERPAYGNATPPTAKGRRPVPSAQPAGRRDRLAAETDFGANVASEPGEADLTTSASSTHMRGGGGASRRRAPEL